MPCCPNLLQSRDWITLSLTLMYFEKRHYKRFCCCRNAQGDRQQSFQLKLGFWIHEYSKNSFSWYYAKFCYNLQHSGFSKTHYYIIFETLYMRILKIILGDKDCFSISCMTHCMDWNSGQTLNLLKKLTLFFFWVSLFYHILSVTCVP